MPKRPQRRIQESAFQREERLRRERSITGRAERVWHNLRVLPEELRLKLDDLSEKPRAVIARVRASIVHNGEHLTADSQEPLGVTSELETLPIVLVEDRDSRRIRLDGEMGSEGRLLKVAAWMVLGNDESLTVELKRGLDEGYGNQLFPAMQRGVMDWEEHMVGVKKER